MGRPFGGAAAAGEEVPAATASFAARNILIGITTTTTSLSGGSGAMTDLQVQCLWSTVMLSWEFFSEATKGPGLM